MKIGNRRPTSRSRSGGTHSLPISFRWKGSVQVLFRVAVLSTAVISATRGVAEDSAQDPTAEVCRAEVSHPGL